MRVGLPSRQPNSKRGPPYVRAIQQSTPSVNAQNLKCRYEDDTCVEMDPCVASKAPDNTCMGVAEGRAWSSPIYLTPPGS